MKLTLTICIAIMMLNAIHAQTPAGKLSAADSILVDSYWKKANKVKLFSQARQAYLDSALAIMPWNAYYWQQKAMPLSKQMKHELAQPYLDSAVKYNPKKYLDYRGYMNCIFRKNYRDALADFYAAKALNGNSGVMDHPYDFYIGLCLLQLNNFDSARTCFQKCIDEKTARHGAAWTHPLHWFYLSVTDDELGNTDMAMQHIDTCLKMNPTFPDAWYVKAEYLEDRKQYKDALAAALKADSLLQIGYSMNEDGGRYEHYPYGLNRYYLAGTISWLQKEAATNGTK